jgi:hypothetical protein
MKGAHVDVSRSAYRKFGVSHIFVRCGPKKMGRNPYRRFYFFWQNDARQRLSAYVAKLLSA